MTVLTNTYKTVRTDDRELTVLVGHEDHEIFLTNDQKQMVLFEADPAQFGITDGVFRSEVVLETPLGRMVIDNRVTVSKNAFSQVEHLDYSFFRHSQKSPITMVLPPLVDRIGLNISTGDGGNSWVVDSFTLFDNVVS